MSSRLCSQPLRHGSLLIQTQRRYRRKTAGKHTCRLSGTQLVVSRPSSNGGPQMGLNYRCMRRLIIRQFGSCKNFWVWVFVTVIVVYLLDLMISGPKDKRVWDGGYLQGGNVTGPPGRFPRNREGTKCGVTCPENQYAFYIKTGFNNNIMPTICFEDQIVISPQLNNGGRGLNIVVVDDVTADVVDFFTVDTYNDDSPLIRYIRTKLVDNHIVLIASYDEVSSKLGDSRRLVKKLGSSQVDSIKFRDSFMMIGQKNLQSGYAIEYHNRVRSGFARVIEKSGCFSIPMGDLTNKVDGLQTAVITADKMKFGEAFPNCGLQEACPAGSVSGLAFTGQGNTDGPQICINGQYILGTGLNDGGRGFNILVLDNETKKPVRMARFDTYEEDSSPLEIFLEEVQADQILVAVTADDASKKLSATAKEHFQEFGSSMIESLRFRDVWYFVGQRNLGGFTMLEQISFSGPDGQWPKPLTQSFCIPNKLRSSKVMPDPLVWRNDDKRDFCKKNDGYVDFCDPAHVDDQYKSVPLMEKALEGNEIYSSPIVIVPGINHNSLVKLLETTSMQSGVDPSMVTVVWDDQFPEYADLAHIFGFKDFKVPMQKTYEDLLITAVSKAWEHFVDKHYLIVLEEEILLGPDFLSFMAQCKLVLDKDESLVAVSGWNPNGYETLTGNVSQLHRVEEFPGLAFMMRRNTYERHLQSYLNDCCSQRTWNGWRVGNFSLGAPETVIPDLSRIYRQPYKGTNGMDEYLVELLQRPRATNLQQRVFLEDVSGLVKTEYAKQIEKLLSHSTILEQSRINFQGCFDKGENPITFQTKGVVYSVFYDQNDREDFKNLQKLCRCFGLFSVKGHKPRGLHEGVLRFSYQHNSVFFVGSHSPYYKFKPTEPTTSSKPEANKQG